MENKIVQEIYINDESNETVRKEYTVSELKDLIAPAVLINSYYAKCPSRYWIWQYEEKEDLEGEKWRGCQSKKFSQYEASNYGRIRDAETRDIVVPYEKNYKDYTAEQLSTLLKKDLGDNNVGYLLVKPHLSVHQLVADAWLKPFKGKIPDDDNLEIHHISNDGYDNNPYNLIYVLKTAHTGKGGIHGGLAGKIISFYSCYPGPRRKLI